MNKQIIIIGMAVLLVIAGLSGCFENKNNENQNNEKTNDEKDNIERNGVIITNITHRLYNATDENSQNYSWDVMDFKLKNTEEYIASDVSVNLLKYVFNGVDLIEDWVDWIENEKEKAKNKSAPYNHRKEVFSLPITEIMPVSVEDEGDYTIIFGIAFYKNVTDYINASLELTIEIKWEVDGNKFNATDVWTHSYTYEKEYRGKSED